MPSFNKTVETKTTKTTVTKADGTSRVVREATTITTRYQAIAAAIVEALQKPRAQDKFYEHVNFEWINDPAVVVPAEYPAWGSFYELMDATQKKQVSLLEDIASKAELNEDEAKLFAIWTASVQRFKDWAETGGSIAPVDQALSLITELLFDGCESWTDASLAAYLAHAQKLGIAKPFLFHAQPSLDDSKAQVLNLDPYGLSLPSRDYYFDDKFEEKRAHFLAHTTNVAKLVGEDRLAPDFAAAVIRFETKLAQISMKRDQEREFSKYYTITSLDTLFSGINELRSLDAKEANYPEGEGTVVVDDATKERIGLFLESLYGNLNLRATLEANFAKSYPGSTANQFPISVNDGDYFRRVFTLLFAEENKNDLLAYLQYKAIHAASQYSTQALDAEFFDFYNRKIYGQREQKSDEKRSVALVNSWTGFLFGKVFVNKYFSEADKVKVVQMIAEVAEVMGESIKRNDWLTPVTKEAALEKLATFRTQIGFPDKWKSYESLVFEEGDSLWTLYQKVKIFSFQVDFLHKINTPVDKSEWEIEPQVVNAYYHPSHNIIVFPAAFLQPPYYTASIDQLKYEVNAEDRALAADDELVLDAVNFGGIGAVIAHEVTHGYDDQGRSFDKDGNMNDWWTPEDAALFESKCDIMALQEYTFTDPETGDVHKMNPRLCMGENLADLGGVSLAVQAFSKRVAAKVGAEEVERRLALLRIFFSAWASHQKTKMTKEAAISRLAMDPHAPGPFRAGVVANVEQFYEAFGIKEGDGMYLAPEKRVVMW
ncbi:hypothetical protein HDU79_001194 [Rhizoclosmatium sp. JEL0117]|nr:hypothetical protein HDU79_001194 [Rhizoclosmatium sp. JEL0117]